LSRSSRQGNIVFSKYNKIIPPLISYFSRYDHKWFTCIILQAVNKFPPRCTLYKTLSIRLSALFFRIFLEAFELLRYLIVFGPDLMANENLTLPGYIFRAAGKRGKKKEKRKKKGRKKNEVRPTGKFFCRYSCGNWRCRNQRRSSVRRMDRKRREYRKRSTGPRMIPSFVITVPFFTRLGKREDPGRACEIELLRFPCPWL